MPAQIDRFVVPDTMDGERLDRALEALVDGYSRSQLQKLVRRGRVRVAGKEVHRSNGYVAVGDEIEIEHERVGDLPPVADEVKILTEDESILVVVKPSGMLTHAADRATGTNLASLLDQQYGPLPTSRGEDRPGIVHRLDRETSGVLVIARTEKAMAHLRDQFRAQTVEKDYVAIVSGHPSGRFQIYAPIGPVPGKPDRQMIDHTDGKDAVTDVNVIQTYLSHSLLALRIQTGRRHQIRVHLAERGFPVVGDPMYGTKRQVPLPIGESRLALHSHRIAFEHPATGERVEFESALPEEMESAISELEG
ncbi:MAG: RluA family pseudouridine synthase [Planctomycetota bacterium]